MFERFTDRARGTIVKAQEEARGLGHNYIGTEHLLLGLLAEREGLAATALMSLGVSLDRVRAEITQMIGLGAQAAAQRNIPFTPRSKKVLEMALREALQLGHSYIGTEHVLLGLIREGEGVAVQALHRLGVEYADVRRCVLSLMSGASKEVRHERRVLEGLADGRPLEDLASEVGADVEELKSMLRRMAFWRGASGVRLTGRESEVLRVLATGVSGLDAATSLGTSLPILTTHLRDIVEKLWIEARWSSRPLPRVAPGDELPAIDQAIGVLGDALRSFVSRLEGLEERIARLEPPAQEAEEA